jgi:hypothetical protein
MVVGLNFEARYRRTGGIEMRGVTRLVVGLALAIMLYSTSFCEPTSTHAAPTSIHLLGNPTRSSNLVPGAPLTVVLLGLHRRLRLCLGMASLGDAFAIPVTLGVFRATSAGPLTVSTWVPVHIFPAEPPGRFLLFAGICTGVSPEGNLASLVVNIQPNGTAIRPVG